MIESILLVPIFISFFCTFLVLPYWIKKVRQVGLVWEDMNKLNSKKDVAGSGGVVVVLSAMIGIFIYIALQTFYFKTSDGISLKIFAILSSMFLVTLVGLVDDLFGWRKGGLSKRSRIILVLFSAIPLMVINSGNSTMMGINFGIIYPLILIPFGILGATTTFNFLAGYNGLEAGQGIIILSALAFVTFKTGNSWLSIVALCMVASLFAFYIFNKYPARVFPGDVMTYAVGMMIATIAILGNIEKIAIFFFIPYMFETVLKLRGNLKKQSFGKPNRDGSLELRYDKIYGLEHLAIWTLKRIKRSGKAYEWETVYLINGFQIAVILLGFLLFLN
jgi:UDP-N-acetylglucosamine--dolichyl-phosphate N-acetylglucosaminephosphotransferase